MRRSFQTAFNGRSLMMVVLLCLSSMLVKAQPTTITTLPNPPYNGGNSLAGPSNISFVINNTNPYAINLTSISNWCNTTENNSVWQLYYSSTSLTGTSTDVTAAPWIHIATSQPTAVAANGITVLNFPGLNFNIPASTGYRFVLRNTGPGNTRYSGSSALTPNSFSGGGVELLCGDAQFGGGNVGYSGSGINLTLTPRYYTGAITFEPAAACTAPPVPGTVTSTENPVCLNTPFTLSLQGGTGGMGQTYQWQISDDGVSYSDIPAATGATLTTSQTASKYYRAKVTCGGNTVESAGLQVVTPPGVQGVFTINDDLPTGGTNFNSFNDAYNYIKCGIIDDVVFNVDPASGPYNEQLIMTEVPGASATATVTFNGNGRTISFLSTSTSQRAVIGLHGADFINFNELVVEATGTTTSEYGYGFHISSDANSNTINNCTININTSSTSTNYAGIAISPTESATTSGVNQSDFNIITNNTITGGYYGITQVGSSTSANFGNEIKNNIIRDFHVYGIYILGSGSTVIEANDISRPTRTTLGDFTGIYFTSLSTNALVTRNKIHSPFEGNPTTTNNFTGIHFTGVDPTNLSPNKITNNLIYNIRFGADQYGLYNSSSNNTRYYHNTISLDGPAGEGSATDLTRGFHQVTSALGIDLRNNIFTITREGPTQKTVLYFSTDIGADNAFLSNYNDLYLNAAAGTQNIGYVNDAYRATLVDWQTGSGQDANSISVNPIYTDIAVGNAEPTTTAVDNLGTPSVGVTVDINNDTRSVTTPDMGADEFTPAVCVSPPTAGAATVGQSPVCVNSMVQLSLSGNTIGLTQTYRWQRATAIGGPYTAIGNVLTNADTLIEASSTAYYRVAVTCSGNTTFSAPVLLEVNPALPSGTYVIDQTNGPGTDYLSFAEAKAALSCGIDGTVVFEVAAGSGPYLEQLILDSIPGTSASSTVTFNGNGNVIEFNSTNTNERATIKLNSSDYVTINNLVINAGSIPESDYGYGVQIINNADFNTISNCTININTTSTSTTAYAGILINSSPTSVTAVGDSHCDNNLIQTNTITGGYAGVAVVADDEDFQTTGNRIMNNTISDFYAYGIYANGTTNFVAEGNNISRPTRTNSGTIVYGVYLLNYHSNARVAKNRIHNMYDAMPTTGNDIYGIYLNGADAPSATPTVVSNNALYNLNGEGVIYGMYNNSSDNARYYHNTITIDNVANTSTAVSRGFYQLTAAEGIELRNNIITISRGGTGLKFAFYRGTSTTVFTSNYNNFYVDPSASNAHVGYTGTPQTTLADWQAASGQDANSLSYDPLYTNASTGNLKPTFAPLDDKGTPVGITTDIVSAPRSSTIPDIGAWEFAVAPCVEPPTAGTSAAVPNVGMCLGTPIQLSLTGNSTGSGQTYQWEWSTSATGPWTPMGTVMLSADTVIEASGDFYYRAAITCGASTVFSAPVFVDMNEPFPGGVYTINNTLPTDYPTGTNFNSFVEAVAIMNCGIDGKVTFNVAPGTYTEQVRMNAITGTSATNTVTFQSASGDQASVTLTHEITAAASNYVLQLDSASYIIYRDMTITATGNTNARAIEIARTASNDSLVNLIINVPPSASTSNAIAGIVGTALTGNDNVIKGNTINNGSSGIYIVGASVALAPERLVIDSNTVIGSYYYNIYTSNTKRIRVEKNIVEITAPRNTTAYGIYGTNSDTSLQYVGNTININGAVNTTTYGMYLTSATARASEVARVANNKVTALTGNSGTLYGIYQTSSENISTVNNAIVINTTGASSYGIYNSAGGPNSYYNNSVNSVATSGTNNYAAYFANTSGSGVDVRNNIFAHRAGGRALFVGNSAYVYSDYNMLYSTGPVLVHATSPAGPYANLAAWRAAASSDMNSIVYAPAFTSTSNLMPNVNDPEVWAIHGRGEQIEGNDYDFNNNPRPTTVVAGVPDLGAYEFVPVSTPPVLPAFPAVPAPDTKQVFMFGTDTVAQITWKPTSTIPSSVSVRRYSGVTPPGMAPTAQYMYFYTDIDVATPAAPEFEYKQFYIDPWQGLIPREAVTRLGRTDASSAWIMDSLSTVDTIKNTLRRDTLHFMNLFTGMTDSTVKAPPPPPVIVTIDSSNAGTRFWVAYGHHQGFSSNGQDMVLYLSATEPANVRVKVNGTNWIRNYSIPANTAISSDIIPKGGLADARILDEGLYDRGISIESDVPIVAYAHIYQGSNSGATMLMPVGVYGYEYISLNSRQQYAADCFSWFDVIADRDSTLVEITPVVTTKGGMPAGVPFTVYLNKGQVYQVMGTTNGAVGTDLTGSRIRSIPNESGKCFPIAVFSGSSRTAICNTTNGDNIIQQVFPSQAWGKRFLTFATASSLSNTAYYSNFWRVLVKDPTTVVMRDGVPMTGLVTPGNYYEFGITGGTGPSTASYIESDKPILIAQYMTSSDGTSCSGMAAPGGDGDPEMIYISPIEQGIRKAVFYNTEESGINSNYINVIIPANGLASLTIDGVNTFTDVFDHPDLAGYKCIRHNLGGASSQHIIQSDSAFTAITYGLGSVESYGYNAGTLVKNLNAVGTITNVFASGTAAPYTCERTPFKISMRVGVKPTSIIWHLSEVPGLDPNTDVIDNAPFTDDSTFINGQWYYFYELPDEYVINEVGTYAVPVTISHPSIEGCNNTLEFTIVIEVIPAPVVDMDIDFNGCLSDIAQFTALGTTSNGVPLNNWTWTFGDNTGSTLPNPTKQWAAEGTYEVLLSGIADDGCIDTASRQIMVSLPPVVDIVPDSVGACSNGNITFSVQNPIPGAVYEWFTEPTGGTLVHTGNVYSFNVSGPVTLYVQADAGGCVSTTRKKVTVVILPDLAAPVAVVDSAGADMIRFRWNAVPNATGYEVSTDNGATWVIPSSGSTGLTHTVGGLQVGESVTLIVRAIGGCLPAVSLPVTGMTVTDQVYIPNTFTPNGDGLNDVLRVYSNVITDMRFLIFNQWGEKIFESRNVNTAWDGTYNGKPQPSGVYMYVSEMTLTNGSRIQRKGAINLVR